MTKHSLAAEAATVREGRGRSAATSRPGCCSSAATQQFRMLHRSPGGTVGPRCRRTGEGGNIFIGGAAPRIRLQRGQHSCTRGARGGNETPRWRRGRRAARSTAQRSNEAPIWRLGRSRRVTVLRRRAGPVYGCSGGSSASCRACRVAVPPGLVCGGRYGGAAPRGAGVRLQRGQLHARRAARRRVRLDT